jgi:hypothetical protein
LSDGASPIFGGGGGGKRQMFLPGLLKGLPGLIGWAELIEKLGCEQRFLLGLKHKKTKRQGSLACGCHRSTRAAACWDLGEERGEARHGTARQSAAASGARRHASEADGLERTARRRRRSAWLSLGQAQGGGGGLLDGSR